MARDYCTSSGYAEATAEYAMLSSRACAREPDCGRNTVRDSELGEFQSDMSERAKLHTRLTRLAEFLAHHQPLQQKSTSTARVCNLIRTVYEDEAGVEQKLDFILGGSGEPDVFKGTPILSYRAPFGAKFLGKAVGDLVRMKYKGQDTDFEVTTIELLPKPDGFEYFKLDTRPALAA